MYLHIKCTDSDVLLVLVRSQYVHENTKFSLQSFSSKQISLKLRSFCVCDRKLDFAHLGGTGLIGVGGLLSWMIPWTMVGEGGLGVVFSRTRKQSLFKIA